MVRLMKPILRPITRSPRAVRNVAQAGRDAIGLVEGKAGIARRLARVVYRRERLRRDGFVIWWGQGSCRASYLEAAATPSATPICNARITAQGGLYGL